MLIHVSQNLYEPGYLVLKGHYGRVLRAMEELGIPHPSSRREAILEEIRRAHYPQRPSRLNSAFVFRSMDVAELFHRKFCPRGIFYSVDFVGKETGVHIGDLNGVEPLPKERHLPEKIEAQAHRYWSGEFFTLTDGPNPCEEVLSERHLQVLRHIR